MRLLNPSAGEVMDRVTILELKINAAERQGKDPARFLAEKASLQDFMRIKNNELSESYAHADSYDKQLYQIGQEINALMAVNSLLWDAEDKVRALPSRENANMDEVFQLADLCKHIATLNDKRADQVAKISSLYNEHEEVHEKLYGVKLGA